MAWGLEEFFSHVHQWFREEKGPTGAITFHINIKQGPSKTLRLFNIIGICFPGIFTTRPNSPNIFKVLGYFPVNINIREDCLTTTSYSLLTIFIDHHLSNLMDLCVRHTD